VRTLLLVGAPEAPSPWRSWPNRNPRPAGSGAAPPCCQQCLRPTGPNPDMAAGDQGRPTSFEKPPSGCRSEAHPNSKPPRCPCRPTPSTYVNDLFGLLDRGQRRSGPGNVLRGQPDYRGSLTRLETAIPSSCFWPGVILLIGGMCRFQNRCQRGQCEVASLRGVSVHAARRGAAARLTR